jgi:hypothetical protein
VFLSVGIDAGRCAHVHRSEDTADACTRRHRLTKLNTDRQVVRLALSPTPKGRAWLDRATDADVIRCGVVVVESKQNPFKAPPKPTAVVLYTGEGAAWRLIARLNRHGFPAVHQECKDGDGLWVELPRVGTIALEAALLEAHTERLKLI